MRINTKSNLSYAMLKQVRLSLSHFTVSLLADCLVTPLQQGLSIALWKRLAVPRERDSHC